MTKEQEEAIEKLEHYLKNSVYKKIDSDSFENNWEVVNLEIPQAIETVLSMLKENSAELAEKSAEIEIYKKKNTELSNQLLMLYKEQDNYNARIEKKNAEIEKYKSLYNKALEDLAKTNRKNIENKKVIDLMVKAMNKIQDPQVCKYCDNNINLNNGYCTDAKKCKEGIKKYFERKVNE